MTVIQQVVLLLKHGIYDAKLIKLTFHCKEGKQILPILLIVIQGQ